MREIRDALAHTHASDMGLVTLVPVACEYYTNTHTHTHTHSLAHTYTHTHIDVQK
jgi:hypothetical protein